MTQEYCSDCQIYISPERLYISTRFKTVGVQCINCWIRYYVECNKSKLIKEAKKYLGLECKGDKN